MLNSQKSSEFLLDVARGKFEGKEVFGSYGRAVAIGTASGVLWPNGAFDIPSQSSPPTQLEIVSDSANDAPAGTGIRSVHIYYLDATLTQADKIVSLNGITPNSISFPDGVRFVQCMHLDTFGTLKAAAGNITLRAVGPGQTYSYIEAGETRCSSSLRMVPKGKRCHVLGAIAGASSGTASAAVEVRIVASQIMTHKFVEPLVLVPHGSNAYQDNSFGISFPVPLPFDEGMVIGMHYKTDKAATITGQWFGFIEDV